MVATTSGTTTFSLDVDEIIEQALEPLGGEHQSGIDAEKARRTLNLVLIMLQNKEIPLSKLEFTTQTITSGTAAYVLNTNIVDVLDCSVVSDSTDLSLERLSIRAYQDFPKKATSGRPTLFMTQRNKDAVTMTMWPVPDATYTTKLLVSKKIEDITASYQKIDINTRYLPLLIAWLSYELSKSKSGIEEVVKARLEKDYKELLPDTFEEDRERTDDRLVPGGICGR